MPAKLVQRRRGTTANHSVFAGAEGEITQDTTKNTLVCHDGNTQGGHPLAKEDMSNVIGTASGGGVGITQLNLSDGSDGQVLTTDGSGNISFRSIDVNTDLSLGGDLTGSISDAQIITNAVGINELNVDPPVNGGQLLSADSSGNLEFISPTNNMNISGDVSGPLSNAQIVSQAVGTPELATGAVTTIKIADLNVTSDKIADGSITSNKIAGLSVTTDKITDGNITLAKMADNSIRTGNIIDGNITSSKIANNSVGIAQLNVNDGSNGQVLSTNGAGVLSFVASLALGGDLTGTTDNAVIADGAVEDSMIVGLSSSKIIGGVGIVSMQVFESLGGSDNSEQTWTKPAGVNRILYFVTGAGGTGQAGGGSVAGTGGASGATAIGVHDVSGINSLQLRVGTGGAPGNSQNQPNLPNGFNSYLGDLVPGTGNPGQTFNEGTIATGGAGQGHLTSGTALGGTFRLPGRRGYSGYTVSGVPGGGGQGANSFWSPLGDGGNGGGGSTTSPSTTTTGGRGEAGVVVIFEFA